MNKKISKKTGVEGINAPPKKNLLTIKKNLKRKQEKGLKRMKNRYFVDVEDSAVRQIWTLKSLS